MVRARQAGRAAVLLAAGAAFMAGCAANTKPTPPAQAAAGQPVTDRAQERALAERLTELEETLELERQALTQARQENEKLRQELRGLQGHVASIEERYAALEIELASAVEEVLRSKATIRGVQSRALATSRISEVRVQIESSTRTDDPEVAIRLRRANEFLARADQALEQGNFSGASYLAERASEMVRQARIVAEVRQKPAQGQAEIIPIVPPRTLEVLANSNLREGPGLSYARVGGLEPGDQALAVARAGEWYQVETESGLVAWIHGRLVE